MNRQQPVLMSPNERYRIRYTMKADGEDAEIMVYSDIVSDKWFPDDVSTGDFDKSLKDAKNNGAKNLNIRINSPGGEVYAAVAMRSMVINAEFDSVRVMIEGMCASAATLFATIPEAHVVIADGSEFMIHNPMTVTWGNANEIEKTVEHLRKMEGTFRDMYAARTGKDLDTIKEWMDSTTWFTAKEAVENGFCDELLETERIAACVTEKDMVLMQNMYGVIPEQVMMVTEPEPEPEPEEEEIIPEIENVSNGTSDAGEPSEILEKEESPMELENLTMDQLRDGNPALFAQVQSDAIEAERERLADIDALTIPGYEALAEQAKADGTSVMEFQKQIVKAMKEKGENFLKAREAETAPAQDVIGSEPVTNQVTEEEEIKNNAKVIAEYAKQYDSVSNSMF